MPSVPAWQRRAAVDALVAELLDRLSGLPASGALEMIADVRSRLDGVEAQLLSRRVGPSASPRALEAAVARSGRLGRREVRNRAARAAVLDEWPELAEAIAAGEISSAQGDALVMAAEKSSVEKVRRDPELVAHVRAVEPDQGRRVALEWVRRERDPAAVEDEFRRQRSARSGRFFEGRDGTIGFDGRWDPVVGSQIRAQVEARADELYRRDGGRELPAREHPRTHEQRVADAMEQLVTDRSEPTGVSRPNRRAQVIITAPIEQVLGNASAAELVGHGPIPSEELDRLACNAEILGLVFGGDGQPLWVGRAHRTVTNSQWSALAARDGGCVLCGKAPNWCEAHHLVPWNAPARGRTDVDNLAMLCASCHHFVHDNDLTVIGEPPRQPVPGTRLGPGTWVWRTRAASDDERAPTRPRGGRSRAP